MESNFLFSNQKFNNNKGTMKTINTKTTTSTIPQQAMLNGSKFIGNKFNYNQKKLTTKKNINNIINTQSQPENQKPTNFFPSRNSQLTSKNSCSLPTQKRKKNTKSLKSLQNFQLLKQLEKESKYNYNNNNNNHNHYYNNNSDKNLNSLNSDMSTLSQYAPNKSEVPAGLPQHLFASRKVDYDSQQQQSQQQLQHSQQQLQKHSQQPQLPTIQQDEQSQIRRMSFESLNCSCCKPFAKPFDGSEGLQYYVIKLPGMSQLIYVPKPPSEKNDVISAFSPPKMNFDQIRVKLPGMQNNNNPVPLCEEPWWLSTKEEEKKELTSSNVKESENDGNQNFDNEISLDSNPDDDVTKAEEYESAYAVEVHSSTPNVKLPKLSYSSNFVSNVKLDQKKKEYLDDYYYYDYNHLNVTTSENIEFDKEQPIVQLHPKPPTPISRCNLPNLNLKIETNLKLDEDRFFKSADGSSTLSTPTSEKTDSSSLFSNMSTYAETESTVYAEDDIKSCNTPERRSPSVLSDISTENTVFTEEEITKSCNTPERRSPSVLSNISSEHLSPVLEEEEEEEDGEPNLISFPIEEIEECQEETVLEEQEIFESNTHSSNESENEDSDCQEVLEINDNKGQVEYMLPELRKIVEKLEEPQFSNTREATRIRQQLEIMNRDNYPDYLPLTNNWTMYFSDTSVTKTITTKTSPRIISKNKYSSTLNSVFKCSTVPELCSRMREFSSKIKPSDLKTNANLSFFRENIMPMWEDEANHKGGRFTLCPPRCQLNSLWNSIVFLLAGNTIDDNDFICGAVCARRDRGDRVELWISGDAYQKDIDHIRDLLEKELGVEMIRNVKYKKHLGKL